MPRIKELLDRSEEYRAVLVKRHAEGLTKNLEEGLALYKQWKQVHTELQKQRTRRNELSRQYGKTRDVSLLKEAENVKTDVEKLKMKLSELEDAIQKIELTLPNWLDKDVPEGAEEDAKPIEYAGTPVVWTKHRESFEARYPGVKYTMAPNKPFHHYDLVGKLIDQDIAAKISGSRFYCELDDLVLLDFALSLYAIDFFRKRGYSDRLMITPYLMRKSVEEQITYFTSFEDTIFELEKEGLILIPSSEHTIVAYYMGRLFEQKELPLRILAWSPCFRKEAGAHGKDTKGMFRAKQFHKLEIHCIVKKGEDFAEVEKLRKDIQQFMLSLGLPNRSVVLASADADMRALKHVDIETWMPAQARYRETHSIATMGTWVSEKVKMRYRTANGKEPTRNVYATGVATQRTICAIVENHYNFEKNVIEVPEVLRKYMLGVEEIKL